TRAIIEPSGEKPHRPARDARFGFTERGARLVEVKMERPALLSPLTNGEAQTRRLPRRRRRLAFNARFSRGFELKRIRTHRLCDEPRCARRITPNGIEA